MKGSCSHVQSEGVRISVACGADFVGQELLEDCAFGCSIRLAVGVSLDVVLLLMLSRLETAYPDKVVIPGPPEVTYAVPPGGQAFNC